MGCVDHCVRWDGHGLQGGSQGGSGEAVVPRWVGLERRAVGLREGLGDLLGHGGRAWHGGP